jgi:hypothetical protein
MKTFEPGIVYDKSIKNEQVLLCTMASVNLPAYQLFGEQLLPLVDNVRQFSRLSVASMLY